MLKPASFLIFRVKWDINFPDAPMKNAENNQHITEIEVSSLRP